MEFFRAARDLIVTIPGISTRVADVIIAEIGVDMTRFPTAGHLASWAGTCLGSNESAGRVKSTHTRPGNPYLKGALGTAALAAARSNDTYYSAKYRRIASRRGPIKAVVAVEHAMLIAVWNMLQTGTTFTDPGADFRGYPEKVDTRYAALAASCNASSKSMGLVFLFFSHLRVVLYQFTYHSIPVRSSSRFEKTCR